jgi:hypothetical protein
MEIIIWLSEEQSIGHLYCCQEVLLGDGGEGGDQNVSSCCGQVFGFGVSASLAVTVLLAKPGDAYFTIFYDDVHRPAAVRACERPSVVSFGWL